MPEIINSYDQVVPVNWDLSCHSHSVSCCSVSPGNSAKRSVVRRGKAFLSAMTLEDRRLTGSRVTTATQTTLVSCLSPCRGHVYSYSCAICTVCTFIGFSRFVVCIVWKENHKMAVIRGSVSVDITVFIFAEEPHLSLLYIKLFLQYYPNI
jgi:hypothetical protein